MKLRYLYFVSLILLSISSLNAQQRKEQDRLVRLIKAETAETFENENFNIKRVTGNAQFLHNNALIICDTAIWNVTENVIDAIGNVKIVQAKNILSGDRIHYIADSSLAQVRGSIVQLLDKDSNRLRTLYLDYNTKDSIGYFYNGGSMMDTSGKVIESLRGYYHSKIRRFKFLEQVEMTADDMVLKSDSLAFWSDINKVDFLGAVNAWQKDGFLSSQTGWYERDREAYNFEKDAYILNSKNEIWGNRILYQKDSSSSQLWDNVQIVDTAQSIIMFADYALFKEDQAPSKDNRTWAKLYKKPSIAYYSIEKGVADTLFFSADSINYKANPIYLVDSATIALSNKRVTNTNRDPVQEMYGKSVSHTKKESTLINMDSTFIAKDSTIIARDTSLVTRDSIPIIKDTTLIQRDSTLIRFVDANKNVKFYRSDFQGKCDSLKFNTIDSIIRLYIEPVLWNEGNQFSADSIQLLMANNTIRKLDLISNSFIASPEDSIHCNQVKSTDMTAYFTEGDLNRFDAFGGVTLLFFVAEDSILTTMNKKECKVMTARIKNKQAERIKYIENVPSDAFAIIDLKPEQKVLKGFKLRTEQKPKDRYDVCDRSIRPTRREEINKIELPSFTYTLRFFNIKPQLPISTNEAKTEPTTKQELPIIDDFNKKQELSNKTIEESSLL